MNPLKEFLLERLSRYMQRKGIGLAIDNFSIMNGLSLKYLDIDIYRERAIVGTTRMKVGIISLLRGRPVMKVKCEDITIMPGNLSETEFHIDKLESIIRYDRRKKDISVNVVFNETIGLSCRFIGNGNEKECFVKTEQLSIDQYKQLFDGHIISDFMKSIRSASPVDIACYYKHDCTSLYPKLNATFRYDPLQIVPDDCILSKEYLLGELKKRKHLTKEYRTLEQIPEIIRRTVICTEDPSFELHKGISQVLAGMTVRANIQKRALVRGGSTISMQLIKNALLNGERTFIRKTEEAILTLLMENHYRMSKQDILEVYLNMIEFAPDVYGVEEAAQFYFGKPSSRLGIVETLVLTYIIPRPIHFHEALLQQTEQLRRNLYRHIRQYMDTALKKGIITPDEAQSAETGIIEFSERFGKLSLMP